MLKYNEICDKITEMAGGNKKFIDTYLYGQIVTTDPDHFAEAMLKIIGFGFQVGGREIGREFNEELGGLPPNEAEKKLIMEEFHRHSINALSMSYTVLVQIPLSESVPFIQKSVEHLFDIGYRIVKMGLTDEDLVQDDDQPGIGIQPEDLKFDFSDDDLGFLDDISSRFGKGG